MNDLTEKWTHYSTDQWTLLVTTIGVVAGLLALLYAWRAVREAVAQRKANTQATFAELWLSIRGVIANYDDIHANFRPGGPWHGSSAKGPSGVIDVARTEVYMGLFEYCEVLLEDKLIDGTFFPRAYKYRLENMLSNKWVANEKLRERRDSWLAFINLCYRLKVMPEVPPLSPTELLQLYPANRKSG